MGFMAKTYVKQDSSTALMDFWIKSLTAKLDRSEAERSLCPVRVLRFYLSRTDTHQVGRKSLFLPLREPASRKLSPNTISVWLKKMILLAYKVIEKNEELRHLHLSKWQCN